MEIHFILVEPALPENIGSSARAIKTMGFQFLRLVNPCNHLDKKAQWLAHGSIDILKKARLYSNFKESIHDMDFIIGTTSKRRRVKYDYYTSNEIPEFIKNKSETISKVAIVFGREDKGLLNNELQRCDIVSSIPMQRKYPSLNLAQAVIIYAYSLSQLLPGLKTIKKTPTNQAELRVLKKEVAVILQIIDIQPESNIYNRIMERLVLLGNTDIHLLHSICNGLSRKLNNTY